MLDWRGWLGSAQHIVKSKPSKPQGLRIAWRRRGVSQTDLRLFYLEEVGEDLRADSLLEDDLEDGGALAGEDVLTGPGLA